MSWRVSWAVQAQDGAMAAEHSPWISARGERGLFTMCCGRFGLALILVQFLLKSVNEQGRVSMWLLDG